MVELVDITCKFHRTSEVYLILLARAHAEARSTQGESAINGIIHCLNSTSPQMCMHERIHARVLGAMRIYINTTLGELSPSTENGLSIQHGRWVQVCKELCEAYTQMIKRN